MSSIWLHMVTLLPHNPLVSNYISIYHESMKTEPSAEALGLAIASVRKHKRWTQRDLAAKLHIHHSMVTRWEKGQNIPRDETLERIAAALEITVDELLSAERKQPLRLPSPVDDPELVSFLSQLNTLEPKDIEALKTFLDAMLTKARIRQMVSPTHIAS